MAKVQTLIDMISYLTDHPNATDDEIVSSINISKVYLTECKWDLHSLSLHVWQMLLRKNEVDLLKSRLNENVGLEREIINKLQKVYPEEKYGLISISDTEKKPTNEYLDVALWSPQNDRSHIDFWLYFLLYDVLFNVNTNGSVDYRLASEYENLNGYSKWRVKLKDDIYWSDGRPFTSDDVVWTMNKIFDIRNTPIQEIKKVAHNEIIFSLFKEDVLFFLKIARIPIFPWHSTSDYEITNGPFLFRKGKYINNYNLHRNKNYYRENRPKIEQVRLKIFNRPSFAVKAIAEKNIDVFFPRSLTEIRQYITTSTPNFLYDDSSYWVLLINKNGKNLDSENKINKLKELVDYNILNQRFSREIPKNIKVGPAKSEINIRIGYVADMPSMALKNVIKSASCCLGIKPDVVVDVSNSSCESIRKTVDVIVGQFYFGHWYSRLRFYFHSKAECNLLGIDDPEVDSLLDKLDVTASIDERNLLGKQILDMLNDKNLIILLEPCFKYILSNFQIEQSHRIRSVSDFIVNLPDITVERSKRIGN